LETWKGKSSHDEADYGVQVDVYFELQITLEDGSFGGIATDPEFSKLSIVPVLVKGQLEGDHIRFIKTYPFWYGVGGNELTCCAFFVMMVFFAKFIFL